MSSIKPKLCKQYGCTSYPKMSCSGFCWEHTPENIKAKIQQKAKERKIKTQKKAVEYYKRKAEKNQEEGMNEWFEGRRAEMTGKCLECGAYTNKHNDKFYRFSVAHIVPKGLIESVKQHPLNWIELCIDHHTQFDSTFDKAADMKCFEEAKRRFNEFKHLIPAEELRKLNPHLL